MNICNFNSALNFGDEICEDIVISEPNTALKGIVIKGHITITSAAKGATVFGCTIECGGVAISSDAEGVIIKSNKIKGANTAVSLECGALNCLIALNECDGAISVSNAENTSLVLNQAAAINAQDNRNIYIVNNTVSNEITVKNNNYLICDENSCSSVICAGNDNINGDNVTDVTERLAVGANEKILPHIDRELFVGMERQAYVRDCESDEKLNISAYINKMAEGGRVVIVPPGAYTAPEAICLTALQNNATVYAYGAYEEFKFDTEKNKNNLFKVVDGGENILVKGLTMGYDHPSCGQVHILEVLGDNKLRVVASAGFPDGFKGGDVGILNSNTTPDIILGERHVTGSNCIAERDENGVTMTLTLTNLRPGIYEVIRPGDMMYCRLRGENAHAVYFGNNKSAKLKDCTLYGYTSAMAFVCQDGGQGVELERVFNSARKGYVIDEATYNKYLAIQKEYGVEGLVYTDKKGRYRGADALVGTADGMHIARAIQGFRVRSCTFERVCDDGSNHRGNHYRLHGTRAGGSEDTLTMLIKGNLANHFLKFHTLSNNHDRVLTDPTPRFHIGDRLYICTSSGKVVCNTPCLSVKPYGETVVQKIGEVTYSANLCAIEVKASDVDTELLSTYTKEQLEDNSPDMEYKLLVDNLDAISAGYEFDNVLFRITRSRGTIVKSHNALIKNCTFRDVAMSGVIMASETETWGESTDPQNITMSKCLFDSTGFRANTNYFAHAPLVIEAFCTEGRLDSMLAKNITVEDCEFRNYGQDYAIFITGTEGVHLKNNRFIPKEMGQERNYIRVRTSRDIEISGNTAADGSPISGVIVHDCKNVYGKDI